MPQPPPRWESLATPIGTLLVLVDGDGVLLATDWRGEESPATRRLLAQAEPGADGAAIRALAAYFAGEIAAIDTLACRARGTPFQQTVWAALRTIPAGTTTSYGTLARTIGRPSAVRAVGLANGANPVGIVVPCHRVIGANGSLTGYGGGLPRKRWLLDHEARHAGALAGHAAAALQPGLSGIL